MHYFLVLKENEPTRDCLRKHDYSDETWLWHCLMQILSFQTSELRNPKREVQIIWLDFPQANPTYLQHWLVEYSHNWASTGSLTLFSLPLLWLKLWCFGSLSSDLTLMNIQHIYSTHSLRCSSPLKRQGEDVEDLLWHPGTSTYSYQGTPCRKHTAAPVQPPTCSRSTLFQAKCTAVSDANPEGTATALKTFPTPWLSRDIYYSQ